LVLAASVAVLLSAALPAAANNVPTTGVRLNLNVAPTTFQANSPFYIEHGFACDLGDPPCMWDQIGRGRFLLYVDSVLQESKVDVDTNPQRRVISKLWLTNFPTGLPAGEHVFVREWIQGGTGGHNFDTTTITFS